MVVIIGSYQLQMSNQSDHPVVILEKSYSSETLTFILMLVDDGFRLSLGISLFMMRP